MANQAKTSIIPKLIENQKKNNSKIEIPKTGDKIGFAFSTKDRVDFSLKSLESIDVEKGFDVIWVDGSDTDEGKKLPDIYKFKVANLVEVHKNIKGGPNKAIVYSLKRLSELGYDYCGLIENDIVFEPGWFNKLVGLFGLAGKDGVAVGAATVRNYKGRVIEFRDGYSINWNIGAGMILFSREAAQLVVDNYDTFWSNGRRLRCEFAETLGIDLKDAWGEVCSNPINCRLCPDFVYDITLYKNGLSSVGSIPSMVVDLDVTSSSKIMVSRGSGLVLGRVSFLKLFVIKISTYFLEKFLNISFKFPPFFRFLKKIEGFLKKHV